MRQLDRSVSRLLTAHGFKLVRQNRHRVWRDANGKTIVTSCSASDSRGAFNKVKQDLRMAMG